MTTTEGVEETLRIAAIKEKGQDTYMFDKAGDGRSLFSNKSSIQLSGTKVDKIIGDANKNFNVFIMKDPEAMGKNIAVALEKLTGKVSFSKAEAEAFIKTLESEGGLFYNVRAQNGNDDPLVNRAVDAAKGALLGQLTAEGAKTIPLAALGKANAALLKVDLTSAEDAEKNMWFLADQSKAKNFSDQLVSLVASGVVANSTNQEALKMVDTAPVLVSVPGLNNWEARQASTIAKPGKAGYASKVENITWMLLGQDTFDPTAPSNKKQASSLSAMQRMDSDAGRLYQPKGVTELAGQEMVDGKVQLTGRLAFKVGQMVTYESAVVKGLLSKGLTVADFNGNQQAFDAAQILVQNNPDLTAEGLLSKVGDDPVLNKFFSNQSNIKAMAVKGDVLAGKNEMSTGLVAAHYLPGSYYTEKTTAIGGAEAYAGQKDGFKYNVRSLVRSFTVDANGQMQTSGFTREKLNGNYNSLALLMPGYLNVTDKSGKTTWKKADIAYRLGERMVVPFENTL